MNVYKTTCSCCGEALAKTAYVDALAMVWCLACSDCGMDEKGERMLRHPFRCPLEIKVRKDEGLPMLPRKGGDRG